MNNFATYRKRAVPTTCTYTYVLVPQLLTLRDVLIFTLRCKPDSDGSTTRMSANTHRADPTSLHQTCAMDVDNDTRSTDAAIYAGGGAETLAIGICCPDGAQFAVALPSNSTVTGLKHAAVSAHGNGLPYYAVDLFAAGRTDPLDDARGPISGQVPPPPARLFMLIHHATDGLALTAFFKNTNGGGWTQRGGWIEACRGAGEGAAHCFGVETAGSGGRVVELVLDSNNIMGRLGSEFQQLTALQSLSLSGNKLTGPIPPELGRMRALTNVSLDDNQLSGPIPPELGDMLALEGLYLGGNCLTGPIPPALGRLAALDELVLSGNQLTGPVPEALGHLRALKGLYLDNNQLAATAIPASLSEADSIEEIDLSGNSGLAEAAEAFRAAVGDRSLRVV